jgi:hypothetical protein
MRRRTVAILATSAAVVVGAAGAATAFGGADGEGQPPASSAETKAATDAALRATGGGTANAVERDGENGAVWEVEVTKPDGQTVDVRLAGDLSVVVIEGDHEGPEDGSGDGD